MNKMDLIEWDPEKFAIIKKKLNYYLHHIGFTNDQIIYVPVSAISGTNITKKLNRHFES
jgi:elongation factor 1 alpha-like protein